MKDHLGLVQGQLDAYNLFDLNSFCSFYHPEIEVRLLFNNQLLSSGICTFREDYAKLFQKFPEQICVLKSRIVKDNTIIDEEIVYGRPSDPEGKHAVAIYGFRDGLIDRVWFV